MTRALLALVLMVAAHAALAQNVLVDRAQRAADLWCFPVAQRPHEWKYLPATARLATSSDGKPEFSFIRYARGSESEEGGNATITEAEGGGVLHLLALYDTDRAQVDKARAALRASTGDDELALTGPIVFEGGRYAVISSILSGRKILETGSAPVLEGNRVALSFDLDKTQAALLFASLKMKNPDVSITFDMDFAGLADAYDATIDVDWSLIAKSETIAAGGKIFWFGADVKSEVESLVRNGAVTITSRGEHGASEALLTAAHAKIVELLFQPAPAAPQQAAPPNPIASLLGQVRYVNLYGQYAIRDIRSSGRTTISLNHQAAVHRHTTLTVNIGELYTRYGTNPQFFRTVNVIADRVFQKRKVFVSLDGALVPEFEKLLNSVSVTLRKTHGDGTTTLGETVIVRSDAAGAIERSAAGRLALTYGYAGDDDGEKWLAYEYRTKWSFQGGAKLETPWIAADGPMISVFVPYEHRSVQAIADAAALQSRGVSVVTVRVAYPFFGSRKTQQWTYRVGRDEAEHTFDVTLAANEFDTDVTLTWKFTDGREVSATKSDASGVVLLDELPQTGKTGGTP